MLLFPFVHFSPRSQFIYCYKSQAITVCFLCIRVNDVNWFCPASSNGVLVSSSPGYLKSKKNHYGLCFVTQSKQIDSIVQLLLFEDWPRPPRKV